MSAVELKTCAVPACSRHALVVAEDRGANIDLWFCSDHHRRWMQSAERHRALRAVTDFVDIVFAEESAARGKPT